jgi:hypothetical protein
MLPTLAGRFGRTSTIAVAIALLAIALPACRGGMRAQELGTRVAPGDTLHGRMAPDRCTQCLTFEGVESSLLDLSVVSDQGSMAAPMPTLSDPEGRPVELTPYLATAPGAATLRFEGVPLRRTGVYRVTMAHAIPGHEVYYRASHRLRFPPVEGMAVRLQSQEPSRVYVAAPRGGHVTATIAPRRGSSVVPDFHGVIDPWGGRALDAAQVPQGTTPAMADRMPDGTMTLRFVASRPGVYAILAAAKPGCEGDATVTIRVFEPSCPGRDLMHPNVPCYDYGVPGTPATGGIALSEVR